MPPKVMGGKTQCLWNRMTTINDTIDECIKKGKLFPALILIYSSIDVLASLQNRTGFSSDTSYKKWIKKYIFTKKNFTCNEHELWGARNSILHTLKYKSENKNLREIVYGFHWYDHDIRNIKDPTKEVGIYIDDLYEAFKAGCEEYLAELEDTKNPFVDQNLENLPKYIDVFYLGEYVIDFQTGTNMKNEHETEKIQKLQETETSLIGSTADMLAVVALIITIIYTDGRYDAWDFALSILAFWLCCRRLLVFKAEDRRSLPRIIARFGVALSLFVIVMLSIQVSSLFSGNWYNNWINSFNTSMPSFQTLLFDWEVGYLLIVAVFHACVTFLDNSFLRKYKKK